MPNRNIKSECSYSFSNAIRTLAMVRVWGLEPQRVAAREPKSRMSTNFIIPAYEGGKTLLYFSIVAGKCQREIEAAGRKKLTPWALRAAR